MLEEIPAVLLRSTIDNFQLEPDLQTVDRINDSISLLKTSRENQINEETTILANLTRQLEISENSLKEFQGSEPVLATAEQLQENERKKFTLAKNLNDLEMQLNNLNLQLNKLNNEYDKADQEYNNFIAYQEEVPLSSGLDGVTASDDSTVLKLKLYRSLGIKIEQPGMAAPDTNPSDLLEKVVIYNKVQDTTNILKLDEKYSDYFVSNYVWDRIGTE
ncbi:hypothetical protein BABINDRAFT_166452 [Babjeviella inositovora NRRL Y-12698]|uniref:Kinetochore protein Spc24 n=1 Tax=Babjeviella inositovora NRRL Y-12698 TaxID=984486 RepID=A0A1E3QT39_9ASCO|nr:uncharacterized protein BABINDRAFT_166452 [Babjeviella inositovora NRRL Y-12698]ODQ80883.1 hypothetical protein BABINDRAFT_166452 [Babjeviella inositovora NRRL Y-12698]